jgi:Flp pilus assembly secretin CpaC
MLGPGESRTPQGLYLIVAAQARAVNLQELAQVPAIHVNRVQALEIHSGQGLMLAGLSRNSYCRVPIQHV